MTFAAWLKPWMAQHPLRESSDRDRSRYTAQVMARVKAPAHAPQESPWHQLVWGWPRLVLATAAVAAGVLLVVGVRTASRTELAKEISSESELLAALDEPAPLANGDALEADLQEQDLMVLAEAQPSDQQWIDQTLQLLDQLDEDTQDDNTDASANPNGEEWLKDLQTLDEEDLSTRT